MKNCEDMHDFGMFWGDHSLQREKGSTTYIVGSKILAAKWVFWGMFFLRCKKMLSPNFLKQSKKKNSPARWKFQTVY